MNEIKEWYYAFNATAYGPLSRTEILSLYNTGRIFNKTNVWKNGMADWIYFEQSELMQNVIAPPPINTPAIDDTNVWIVAVMPVILFLFRLLLNNHVILLLFISCCIGLASYIICILDERTLKKAGYDTKELLLWAILLFPVYLFRRAYLFRHSVGYAITWLVLYLSYFIINYFIVLARLY